MMKYKIHTIGYWLLAIFLLAGCVKEECEPEPVVARTILFYLGGDNNLSSEIDYKIEQIQSAALPACTRVLIYKDTRNSPPQLLELTTENEKVKTKVLHDYEEASSTLAESFSGLLQEVRAYYPAPSYGLVVFSHASGWMPGGAYSNPALRFSVETRRAPSLQSVIIDNGSEMELTDFAAAIPDNMFDFIAFEACHMAGIEVAWELKDKTRYLVASSAEIVSPGFASCYPNALPLLYRADLTGFCQAIEADYRKRQGDYGSLTLSLIDTKGLEALAAILYGRNLSYSEKKVQAFDRYNGNLFFDLADSYEALLTEQERRELQRTIDGCVPWKTATPAFLPNYGGFQIRAHSGLTTYIPQEQYPKLNEAYKQLKWYNAITNQD